MRQSRLPMAVRTLEHSVLHVVLGVAVAVVAVSVQGSLTVVHGQEAETIGDPSDWSRAFAPIGVSVELGDCSPFPLSVQAVAARGDSVVIAGVFTHVQSTETGRIALWDGNSWSSLGEPPRHLAYDIEFVDDFIVVAGSSNVRTPSPVWSWDGTEWLDWGAGLDASNPARAYDLCRFGDDLLVGGQFVDDSGAATAQVMRWTGTEWSPMGSLGGLPDSAVLRLAVLDGRLYAAGQFFFERDGVATNGIARWDGEAWEPIPGLRQWATVFGLALYRDELVASGSFQLIDDSSGTQCAVASWDGIDETPPGGQWRTLLEGGAGSLSGLLLTDLSVRDDRMWALGNYATDTGGTPSFYSYDGERWRDERPDFQGCGGSWFNGAAPYREGRVLVGSFFEIDGNQVGNVTYWDGVDWEPLGEGGAGLDYPVYAVAAWKGEPWVGGAFERSARGESAPKLAKWDGSRWIAPETTPNGDVHALTLHRDQLVVGGSFRSVGTMGTSNLAILGDEGWTPFEVGPRGVVNSACEYQGELYVAGDFDFVGDRGAYNIARWDGDVWDTVGAGLRGEERYDHVAGLLNYRGDLIAYGNFYSVRSRNVPSVAAWNGGEWRSLGDPPWPLRGTQIDAGTVWDDHLVLSIWDTENSDRYIAIFDGRQWSRLDEIPIRACYALSTYRGQLLISALLDDVFDNILWLWDGSALSILGDGIRGDRIDGMLGLEDDLYLGGTFTYAGKQPSRNFAIYDGSTLPAPSRSSTIKVSPNPMWNETTITFSTSERRNVGVRVFDIQGRLCRTLRDDLPLDSGIHWMMWQGQDEDDRPAPAGVYFVRVDAGPDTRTEKVLVLR
ncbi:MAG: T9SS type A sorting domain-containing protein [Candidatus Eisenbacteria bacterium]|uniref:T9SS type A sorting domain-containing protein n=1 Tax=Eiseniibacteriota bacterium TaxID=2212470 RepID=A0A956NDC3_UNCEI|nr:T9SS type A sorting domain-containing protein [Candidatus Eisenbacteria bacterium]